MLYVSCLAGIVLIPPGCGQQRMTPAGFEKKSTVFTSRFETGPGGGRYQVEARGTPSDGMTLELPPGAVDRSVTLSAGYATGKTRLNAGTPSNVVLIVKVEPDVTFEQPLRIGVVFPAGSKHLGVVGYAIDEQGRFRPIDLADRDMKRGRASFLTFHGLMFTWAYLER